LSDKTLNLIYDAVDEINALGEDEITIGKAPETLLMSEEGGVDSLTFVNLIVAIEQRIMDQTGDPAILVTEEAMTLESHPFRTVGSLADYIATMLN